MANVCRLGLSKQVATGGVMAATETDIGMSGTSLSVSFCPLDDMYNGSSG